MIATKKLNFLILLALSVLLKEKSASRISIQSLQSAIYVLLRRNHVISLECQKDGPFGKDSPVSESPNPDSTSGYSNFKFHGLLGLT